SAHSSLSLAQVDLGFLHTPPLPAPLTLGALSDFSDAHPDWRRALWRLEHEIAADLPGPHTPTPPDFDAFCRRIAEDPAVSSAFFVVVADGERLVGLSNARPDALDPGTLHTGLTGVAPSHRRRGVA